MPYFDLQGMLLTLPALLIGLTLHEFAHGYAAYLLGDPTAKNMGRLTLNPIRHLDPLGAFFLLVFHFGWAKPVPVNPMYLKGDKQRGMLLVSLAGPVTNLLLAIATAVIWKFIEPRGLIMESILFYLFSINIILAVFNVIPVPPLDGSKILAGILPRKYMHVVFNLEKYGYLILIFLMFTGVTNMILIPVARAIGLGITGLVQVESLRQIVQMYFS